MGSIGALGPIEGLIIGEHSVSLVQSGDAVTAIIIAPDPPTVIEFDGTMAVDYPVPDVPDSVLDEVLADLQAAQDQLFADHALWEQLLEEARTDAQATHQQALHDLAVARANVIAQNEETKTAVENSMQDELVKAAEAFRKKQQERHAELQEAVAVIGSAKSAILIAEAERKAERRSELEEMKAALQSPHDKFQKDLADMTVKIEAAKGEAKSQADRKH